MRRAAAQYDIPSSTLHDRISGKVSVGAVSGPPRYLDEEEEEKELVEFLLGCAEVGYPKTVKEVRIIVGKIVAKKQHQDIGKNSRKDIKSFLYALAKPCLKEEQ